MTRPIPSISATALVLLAATVPARAQEPLEVVTTIGMLADMAANLGGDCVRAHALVGPGVDPHVYQPGASDIRRLQQAELILYGGYGLEGRMGAVLERLGETRPVLGVMPAATDPQDLIADEDFGGIDPHLWMDAGLWAGLVPTVAGALSAERPACADGIAARATEHAAALEALHVWVAAAVESIPEAQRVLVTAHDAFGYYARAYDIRVEAIQGIATDAEASVADIRETTALVVEMDVPVVFVESTINPRTIEAVIAAARERGHDVAIGGELYSDAMGAADAAEGTYIGMIHANTRTIVEGLGGTLPPLPEELWGWALEWGMDPEAQFAR